MGLQSLQTPFNRALNSQQELAIQNHLKRLDNATISDILFILYSAANYLFKRSYFDPYIFSPTISSC